MTTLSKQGNKPDAVLKFAILFSLDLPSYSTKGLLVCSGLGFSRSRQLFGSAGTEDTVGATNIVQGPLSAISS